MNKFKIRLADKTISVSAAHRYILDYCSDYISEGDEDFSVCVTQADIDFEREKSKHEDIKQGVPVRIFNDDYLETLAVYRKICDIMPRYDTLLFHGSVIAVDGAGYLFTAKSGTGKSTHTRLWRELFGDRAVMVNDDKPLLKITDDGVIAYGTPWNGKHRLSTNTSVPLRAVCLLTRSDENCIEEILPGEAYQMLLQQTYRPADRCAMIQTMGLLDMLMKKTGFYRLGCNMEPQAALVAFEGMNTKKTEEQI
jgi:hypothetical protein